MATTIQITDGLQKALLKRKMFNKETYEEVIWNLIEDNMELSEETKRDIEEARNEIKLGKFVTLEEAKKRLGL
jgi:predicted transcriptional regulator